MQVKNLSVKFTSKGPVGVAATEKTIVGNYHKLKHVIMQSKCHLIKGLDIFIERGNRKYI